MKRIYLIVLCIALLRPAFFVTDFTYYPEDKTLTKDFVGKSGEIFYNAYYFSNANAVYVKDYLNGVVAQPLLNAFDTTLQTVTYNNNDSLGSTTTFTDLTNQYQYLQYTVTTTDTDTTANKGLFLNFDPLQLLPTMTNRIVIYLRVMNNGSADATLSVNGCVVAGTCAATTDYTNSIPGGTAITSKTYDLQRFSLLYDTTNNSVKVTLNSGAETAAYYDTTNQKFTLQLTFTTVAEIILSYMQMNIINLQNNNLLAGASTCTSNKQCLPGYYCSTTTCGGSCPISCQRCIDGTSANNQCEWCSPLSNSWGSVSPTSTTCNLLDHVDITRFNNINFSSSTVTSNTFTIGFWMFIQDNTKFGDNLINVTLENFMMISIGIDSNKAVSYCNPYILYYRNIQSVTSKTTMEGVSNNSKYSTIKNTWANYSDGIWFYNRCAINTDQLYGYNLFDSEVNKKASAASVIEKTMTMPNYYDATTVDFDYKYTYSSTMKISVINANSINTGVFIKMMTLFSDLIPKSVQLQYYNWVSLSNNANIESLFAVVDMNFNFSTSVLSAKYLTQSTSSIMNASPDVNSTPQSPDLFQIIFIV